MNNVKYCIVDVSGKVPYYDHALCTALNEDRPGEILLVTSFKQSIYLPTYNVKQLFNFNSKKKSAIYKLLKALEVILNYFYLIYDILCNKYDVVHFQWLPFLEYASFEKYFLLMYKLISPKTKFILTQHNIFPHNSTNSQKESYRKRFIQIHKYFDKIIVHTESSKISINKEFLILFEKINVVHHGIFIPENMPTKTILNKKMKFLMFGIQSYYKGTDIFIDAISHLPKDILDRIDITIAGKTDKILFQEKYELANSLGIKWESRFFENEELNQLIMNSDILVFPYRSISQSGALLLALAFGKPMIVSKLSSFIETLDGFPKDAFFEIGSIDSLKKTILAYVNGKINISEEIKVVELLQQKYSWRNSAKKTIELYNN